MIRLAALLLAVAPLVACSVGAADAPAEEADFESQAAGCDGNGLRSCLARAPRDGTCANWCIPQCRTTVASCIRGGGGAPCMSRCRDGDVTQGSGFDTSRCGEFGRAWEFMSWVDRDARSYTAMERQCWCRHWHRIKAANPAYSKDLVSRAAQLMCWGSPDGSVSLPNGDGKGGLPPGAAMAIYCQLNPRYSACR